MSFLSELDEVVWWACDQHGVDPEATKRVSESLGSIVRSRWGGTEPYVGSRPDRQALAEKIRNAYDGTNRDALCQRVGMSRRTFYRLLGKSQV